MVAHHGGEGSVNWRTISRASQTAFTRSIRKPTRSATFVVSSSATLSRRNSSSSSFNLLTEILDVSMCDRSPINSDFFMGPLFRTRTLSSGVLVVCIIRHSSCTIRGRVSLEYNCFNMELRDGVSLGNGHWRKARRQKPGPLRVAKDRPRAMSLCESEVLLWRINARITRESGG
jgi:hypothetical protein